MIDEIIDTLDLINLRLVESIHDLHKNICKFMRLCSHNRIDFMGECMLSISRIYAVNVVLIVYVMVWEMELARRY